LELYQLRHFAAVVETGSFTKAAIRAAVRAGNKEG
jgi:DNA-binding transcriptional LysR family regulator